MSSILSVHRCLELLELTESASYQDARKAYLSLVQRWHPDRFEKYPPLQAHALRMTQEVNAAFAVLRKILPAGESMSDRLFFDSFDTHCADWSEYYHSSFEQDFDDTNLVPEEQISKEIRKNRQLPDSTKALLAVLLYPFKFITDLTVFFVVERPSVPICVVFILLVSLY